MGKLGVQQFNVKFNSLSYRVKGLSEPILMDYYQRGLSERIRWHAMGRPDWGPCRTAKDLQAVTLLAARQLDDITSANKPFVPSVPSSLPSSMIPVPRDPLAMDVDVHAAGARLVKTPTPSLVSFGFYRELCHQRNLCWRCLKTYDDDHRTRKLNPAQSPCPNLPVDSTRMDQFATLCQSQPLPLPASHLSLRTAAVASSPLTTLPGDPAQSIGLLTPPMVSPYGGQSYYQTPPHLFHPPHFFSPYPPYPHVIPPLAPPVLPSGPVVQPGPALVSPPLAPLPLVAAIASVFSEYQDIDEPGFYDLPAGTSSDPLDAGFWTLNDKDTPARTSVLAIDFVSSDSKASRLVISLTFTT